LLHEILPMKVAELFCGNVARGSKKDGQRKPESKWEGKR
jgi:hypothetical protein